MKGLVPQPTVPLGDRRSFKRWGLVDDLQISRVMFLEADSGSAAPFSPVFYHFLLRSIIKATGLSDHSLRSQWQATANLSPSQGDHSTYLL